MCPKVTSEYKTEIKERIIQSAIECFSKYGLDRTRMDDIAQKADLSKGTRQLELPFQKKKEVSDPLAAAAAAATKTTITTLANIVVIILRSFLSFKKVKLTFVRPALYIEEKGKK
jgi:hypothetical protein